MGVRALGDILSATHILKNAINNGDFDRLRAEEVCYNIDKAVQFYTEKHSDGVNKRTQSLITRFMRQTLEQPAHTAHPEPSTSSLDDSISEAHFEGFTREVDDIARTIAVVDSEEDESDSNTEGLGPQ